MIVATRPEPTVRPPSRYQTGVLRYTNSDFLCDLCGKIRIFRCVRVVSQNFCYHGVITLPEGTEMCMPGDNVEMTIDMIHPVAMEQGLTFAIREGGRTVGSGRVASIIE